MRVGSIEQHFLHFDIISGRNKDTSRRSPELTLKLLSRAAELPTNLQSAFPPTPISLTGARPFSLSGPPPAIFRPHHSRRSPFLAMPAMPAFLPRGARLIYRPRPAARARSPQHRPSPPGWAGRAEGAGGPPSGTAHNGRDGRRQNLILAASAERVRASEWGAGIEARLWTGVSGWGTGEGSRTLTADSA